MFRELTDAELALLSDSEKEVYNKELLLYKERMAFVGQLERIEGADYQYRKPKFSGINPIPKIDVPQCDIVAPKKVSFPQGLLDKMRKVVVSYSSFTPPSKIHIKGMSDQRGGAVRIMPTVMPIGKIQGATNTKKKTEWKENYEKFLSVLVGSVFDWKDILCYVAGCILLGVYEVLVRNTARRR
ncbi:hypothetical protein [Coprococcus sp. RTP21428st1_C9_RTP21428_210409]|uniref:hypothetical protein n=1 Tax=Clostridia TaxID=186801 RepID=UPI0032EDE3DF